MLPFLALAGCDSAPAPDPFAGIPGITFEAYRVTGANPAAIRESMNRRRRAEHRSYDAVTHWRIAWKWDRDSDGNCLLAAARVQFKATVRMPSLVRQGVPGEVLAEWDAYHAALRAHEAGHARNGYEHLEPVRAALRNATCTTASAAARAVIEQASQADRAYDRDTEHGVRTGAVFPQPD